MAQEREHRQLEPYKSGLRLANNVVSGFSKGIDAEAVAIFDVRDELGKDHPHWLCCNTQGLSHSYVGTILSN